jgi:hypothetical protein
MRHKPRLIETEAARRGRHAALQLSSRVHTTRAELPVGAQYEFDDMWHNCMVIRPGYPKAVRPLELACIDIASAHKVAYGLKPRMEDATGKRQNITEADMRFLVAHVLCNIGFHRDGCTLFVEGGTAAIRKRMQEALHALSDGRVAVSTSGVDRKVELGKWGYETRGNPDHKAHIESWHNLAQNRLDALPGYTGSNARLDKPEDHTALMRVVDKMLAASCVMPPDLASRLKFPVLDWSTFSAVVDEVYAQIGASNDHALEGWGDRTERQWKAHAADIWHSEADYLRLPQQVQDALAPIIAQEGMTRVARMSRRQVWDRGQSDLVRLPDWAVTVICGGDLAVARPCPTSEIVFVDKDICPEPMIYRLSTCIAPDGTRRLLSEDKTYLWTINPFDPRHVFVTDTGGCYVGRCARVDQVDRADLDAIGHEIGRTRKELDDALAPYGRRAAQAARMMIDNMAQNAALLKEASGEAAKQIEADRSLSADRKAALKDVDLDDLVMVGAERDSGNTESIDSLL